VSRDGSVSRHSSVASRGSVKRRGKSVTAEQEITILSDSDSDIRSVRSSVDRDTPTPPLASPTATPTPPPAPTLTPAHLPLSNPSFSLSNSSAMEKIKQGLRAKVQAMMAKK